MVNLGKYRRIILFSGIGVFVIILCFILFSPLLRQMRIKKNEMKKIESELSRARKIVSNLKKMHQKPELVNEDNLSVATEKIMKQGELNRINFVSTTPKEPVRKDDYVMVPIDITLESGYQELGNFLGSLDSLGNCVVKVDSLEVTPSANDPSKLKTNLTLSVFVLK